MLDDLEHHRREQGSDPGHHRRRHRTPLVDLLANAEFDIKKEAAWAISNATSGGTHMQIKYLVSMQCIKPLCDLINCSDARIVTVALEGLENILKVGQVESQDPEAPNLFCAIDRRG